MRLFEKVSTFKHSSPHSTQAVLGQATPVVFIWYITIHYYSPGRTLKGTLISDNICLLIIVMILQKLPFCFSVKLL